MKILLVCTWGTSTSLLAKKMQEEAKKQQLDITVAAKGINNEKEEFEDWDVILLGPQVRNELKSIKDLFEDNKPIDVIPPIFYGRIDAKNTLKFALNLLNKEE